jgi:hypothetical protein
MFISTRKTCRWVSEADSTRHICIHFPGVQASSRVCITTAPFLSLLDSITGVVVGRVPTMIDNAQIMLKHISPLS